MPWRRSRNLTVRNNAAGGGMDATSWLRREADCDGQNGHAINVRLRGAVERGVHSARLLFPQQMSQELSQ